MATTNKEIINQIVSNGSENLKNNIDLTSLSDNGNEFFQVMETYSIVKNEFVDTLINKIIKTEFFDRAYKNPLEIFNKGKLDGGDTIEQIFVEMAEKKNYREHFAGSSSEAEDLINTVKPKVKVNYIRKNFEYKWKVSVSEVDLQKAFKNKFGLTQLIQRIIQSAYTNMYYSRYEDMKNVLIKAGIKNSDGNTTAGLLGDINNLNASERTMVQDVSGIQDLCTKIKAFSDDLTFMKDKYNLNKVMTHTPKEDLVFFTTPLIKATIDVNVLAFAFNMDKTEIQNRIIIVDDLSFVKSMDSEESKPCLGILADKNLIQYYTTLEKSATFNNGSTLNYNVFLHNHGLCGRTNFVNAVVFRQNY